MRRTLVILLLLANAVLLFWTLPQGAASAANAAPPGRAPREIAMEPLPSGEAAVATVTPTATATADAGTASVPDPKADPSSPAGADAAQTVPAQTAVAPPAAAAPQAAPAAGAADALCVQTAWMPAQRIEVLANDPALRADRRSGQWLRLRAAAHPLWMVFAGPMDKKDILPLQKALATRGVKAQEVFTPWRFALPASARGGLNLGYFDTEAAAQARRDQAVAAGAAQAAVVALNAPQAQRLRARLTDAARAQALIADSDPRAPWQACVAGAQAERLDDAAFGDGDGVSSEPVSRRR